MTNEKEYERFGPQWKAYVMKKSKSDLVDMYRKVCIELQQVKSVDLADVGKRSFVATDVHGVLFHDGFADNREDAIQQTYNAIGDKATTLNFRWIM